jgi:hypothetical protein
VSGVATLLATAPHRMATAPHRMAPASAAALPVAAVLSASQRRAHLRQNGLSDMQLLQHGRGAQSLRSTLFDATIPVGFASLCTPPLEVRSSQPCTPTLLVEHASGDVGSGSFVFARESSQSGRLSPTSGSSANILSAFLPLSLPERLTPRTSLSPKVTPSRTTPPASWTPPSTANKPTNAWALVETPRSLSPCFDPIYEPSRDSCTKPSADGLTCYFDPVHHPSRASQLAQLTSPCVEQAAHPAQEDVGDNEETESSVEGPQLASSSA